MPTMTSKKKEKDEKGPKFSQGQMRLVTDKIETLRRAVATASVRMKPELVERLKANDVPKKDVLPVARTAGVLAAKKTSELIPYCHPIPIDAVEIDFELQTDRVVITVAVEAIWKTGVEMEALPAASISALTVYDMLKPLDSEMTITDILLLKKMGGKSSFKEWVPENFKAAVIVTSDGTARGTRQDKSGKIIEERLQKYGIQSSYEILPDDKELIRSKLNELCRKQISLILTTGGTGLGPRDVTVDVTTEIMDREIPGIMEAARSYGQRRTPHAMLSRGIAVQKGKSMIVNLPGSSKGVRESLNAIFPAVLHAYAMIGGGGH